MFDSNDMIPTRAVLSGYFALYEHLVTYFEHCNFVHTPEEIAEYVLQRVEVLYDDIRHATHE